MSRFSEGPASAAKAWSSVFGSLVPTWHRWWFLFLSSPEAYAFRRELDFYYPMTWIVVEGELSTPLGTSTKEVHFNSIVGDFWNNRNYEVWLSMKLCSAHIACPIINRPTSIYENMLSFDDIRKRTIRVTLRAISKRASDSQVSVFALAFKMRSLTYAWA